MSNDGHGSGPQPRQDSPRRRSWRRRFANRRENAGLFVAWRRFADRCYEWWHPRRSKSRSYAYYGRYHQPTRGRLKLVFRSVRSAFRGNPIARGARSLARRFHDWWHPPSDQPYPDYGYYGRARRSRLGRAVRAVRIWVGNSFPARVVRRIRGSVYDWWYPAVESLYPYYGYHGRARRSRPVLAWSRFKRRASQSAPGRWYAARIARWYEWWYPPVDAQEGRHYYQRRRVSRPIRAMRRGLRWYRNTWFGKKTGWLLDDLGGFIERRVAEDFAWQKVRRYLLRWQTALLLACLLVGGGFGYKIGMPRYRHMMEERYAAQAELFLAKGDLTRAYLRARQVLQFNSTNTIATRVTADLADWANSPFAIYWRRRSVMIEPTVTNRLALASTAMRGEPFPFTTAVEALNAVEPQSRASSTFHLVAGALALKLGRVAEAEQHYTEAARIEPDDPLSRMSLAVIRLQSQDPRIIADARTTLELLNTDGRLGIVALRSLVAESAARSDFARAERLSNQALTNAQSVFADRILHLAILKAQGSESFDAFLSETKATAAAQPAMIGQLAAWMNSAGLARENLTWLGSLPAPIAGQGLLPLARADAFVALKEWKQLEDFLRSERWVGLDHVRNAMLTLSLRNQSGGAGYETAWQNALRLASDSPTALNLLATLALHWGWSSETAEVLWRAADRFSDQAWPLRALRDFYAARRETAGLWRVFQAMMHQDPKDKLAVNNYAMVSLLLGKDLAAAHRFAEELWVGEPANVNYASTYAFSLHLAGRNGEAIKILAGLQPGELERPEIAAYYGVILAAGGQVRASREYLDKSSKALLMPEEAELVARAKVAGQ